MDCGSSMTLPLHILSITGNVYLAWNILQLVFSECRKVNFCESVPGKIPLEFESSKHKLEGRNKHECLAGVTRRLLIPFHLCPLDEKLQKKIPRYGIFSSQMRPFVSLCFLKWSSVVAGSSSNHRYIYFFFLYIILSSKIPT